MAYALLGPRRKVAAPDQTGQNTGNYTTEFDSSDLRNDVPICEIFRAVCTGITSPPAMADIFIDAFEISCNIFGSKAEWDPQQPPLLQPGQSVFFYWDIPTTGAPPTTTLWLRYDPAFYGTIG